MFNLKSVFIIWCLICKTMAVYAPESGQDWTLLRPDYDLPESSYESVPFEFGIIVTPFIYRDDGELTKPPLPTFTRSHTTTLVTSYITVAKAPTPTKEVEVFQIQDGQVQRYPNYPGYDFGDGGKEIEYEQNEAFTKNFKRSHENCDHEDDWDGIEYPVFGVACKKPSTLVMRLENSILFDSANRIGSIVSSRQFQFDGPVPQHGTIYAAGWSITKHGQLALGDCTQFFQCTSGDFYNLYDRSIGGQCFPVVLEIVELKDC